MKKEYLGLLAAAGIIVTVLAIFILYNQWPLWFGKHYILDTRPVDPFDPFRGQFMRINYEISQINAEGFEEGDQVYVRLKDVDGIFKEDGVSVSRPEGDYIRGKVIRASADSITVEYGIEQYFFEQRAELPTENITVEVSVFNGRAKIVQMLHNGEPLEIEYKEFDITS